MNMTDWQAFFGWMTLLHLGLFIFTAVMSCFCRGFVERLHGRLFGLRPDTIGVILYSFLAFYKIMIFVFALIPWLALTILS